MDNIRDRLGVTRHATQRGIVALTLLRLSVGFIMAAHGWQKLSGYEQWRQNVAGMGVPFPDLAAPLAVAGELAGGLGLLVGLLTPIAAFGVLATMAVAIVEVHLGNGLFAKNNGFEFPLTLLCTALFFMLRGPGPYSIDRFLARRKHAEESAQEPSGRQQLHHHSPTEQRS